MHSDWDEFSKHTVVSIEEIKSDNEKLISPKKVNLYCSQHQEEKLNLYWRTDLSPLHC